MTETVGSWRGQHESGDLGSVDRARQKKEREEAEAAGAWSDENCAELEGNPDDAAGRLEWEAKTMARKQVREKAEAEGVLGYYPDGSLKEGLSGWGWVAQRAGEEVRRARHGTVWAPPLRHTNKRHPR